MFRLFRALRKSLLEKSKVQQYALYAAGEIILIVLGIMIAVQINNWNESVKIARERTHLIQSLESDWKNTAERLAEVQYVYDSLTNNMRQFMRIVYLDEEDVSLDTLASLAGSFFRWELFNPNFTTYHEARSSGKMSYLEDSELIYLYANFFERLEDFDNHLRLFSDNYYRGSTWELRKEVGFISYFDDPEFFGMISGRTVSLEECIKTLKKPHISAAFENQWTITSNMDRILSDLAVRGDRIAKKLAQMSEAL